MISVPRELGKIDWPSPLRHAREDLEHNFGGFCVSRTPVLFQRSASNCSRITELGRGGSLSAPTSLSEAFANSVHQHALEISGQLAPKITELLHLAEGWDGENAKAIRPDIIGKVLTFLGVLKNVERRFVLPFIAPTYGGELLLDWTKSFRTLEVQTKDDGWSVVGTQIALNGEREYFNSECEPIDTKLLHFYQWFSSDLLLWPEN